jgi:REP-associated tyrosine transposase
MQHGVERLPKRQRIRLQRTQYEATGRPVLVTICTRDRQMVLTEEPIAGIVASAFRSASASLPVDLLVWCVMPDHLHAVVAPVDGSSVIDWVRRFKGPVAAEARRHGIQRLWQRSFHDHVLRAEEAVAQVAKYVLGNPVRTGFVATWQEWPHRGSLTWDLAELE